jgi:hypothetical protein
MMRELLQMSLSISNTQSDNLERIEYLVHDKIRYAIADKIASVATVKTQHEFHKEYSCRVIVADHDEYWRDVREAAARLSYRGNTPMFIEEGLT